MHLREFVSVSDHHVPSILLQLTAHGFSDSLHGTRLRPAGKSFHVAFDRAYSGLTFPDPNRIDDRYGNAYAGFHESDRRTDYVFRRASVRHAGPRTTYPDCRAQ